MLGLIDRPGLFDLALDASIVAEDIVVRTEVTGLLIVPLGSNRVLLSEKGFTQQVVGTIERIGRRFKNHMVILDAPPCLSTSDPSQLAPLVGQTVVVIEAERTQRKALVSALDLLKVCPSITLLLNKARIATTHSFGDYRYYGS
jgi:Mrp family chromosome partitioning ATPase